MGATVLVVDDSEAARHDMRRILEQASLDLRVVEAADGAQALSIALSGDIDVVVSDLVMPALDGIGLLRGIRLQRSIDSLPVILVTSNSDGATRDHSFEVGVNDYLTKPYSPVELLGRVQVQLRMKALQDELVRANERHKRLGLHDDLTGLANRRHLHDACRRELARCRRHKYGMSLLLIDLDGFRDTNNQLGHLIGDAIIAELGALLQRDLRAGDLLSRLGGPKFGMLLPQTDARHALQVGERLRAGVELHPFPGVSQPQSVSVGIATYPTGRIETVDEIINAAEACLDDCKGQGGGKVIAHAEPGAARR